LNNQDTGEYGTKFVGARIVQKKLPQIDNSQTTAIFCRLTGEAEIQMLVHLTKHKLHAGAVNVPQINSHFQELNSMHNPPARGQLN
jgi:hypothetical protein